MNVTAKDLGSGKEQKITITASSNLSDDEVNRAVQEAQQFAEADKKRKDSIDAVNEADAMVFQAEKTVQELGDKIDAADKAAIENASNKLKGLTEACKNTTPSESQVAEIKAATEELTKAINDMASKLYQQQGGPQGGTQGGPQGNTGGSKPDDDVVDADFKEV